MIKCFDNIFSRLIIISRCFRGGVMKAAADVLGDQERILKTIFFHS